MRILELYAGIGGVSVAAGTDAEVVLAVEQSPLAVRTYRHNFRHPILCKTVESVSEETYRDAAADLWWASPPCQPFTRKGSRRFLEDPRSATFLHVLGLVEAVRPPFFALENVEGFVGSPGHDALLESIDKAGYAHFWEDVLTPTQFGLPNSRPRYFCLASLRPQIALETPRSPWTPLSALLESDADPAFAVEEETLSRFRFAIDLVNADDQNAVTSCFGSGYGRSVVRSGSYLAQPAEPVRRFTPMEVKRLLGFPDAFGFPAGITDRQAWKLLGNSLSIPCVRHVLARAGAVAADSVKP